MPRYFFNAIDGVSVLDEHGVLLTDLQEAKYEAVRLAGRLLLDYPERFWKAKIWSVEVTDAVGLILFELHLTAALSPAMARG